MKKLLTFSLIFFLSIQLYAQIEVQTIAYWGVDDAYDYNGHYQKYKVTENDTIYEMDMTYDVSVKVLAATDTTYTVQWVYTNYELLKGNKIAELMSQLEDSIKVVFTTDELGAFKAIQNMDEIISFYDTGLTQIEKKNPDISEIIDLKTLRPQLLNPVYIQNNAVKDLMYFHTFHGAKYELEEEYTGDLITSNNYGGNAFDTAVKVWLDEIDTENNTYVIRSVSTIDSEQLTKETYNHLKNTTFKNDTSFPSYEDFPKLANETFTANRIHGTGWTTFSTTTKEVTTQGSKGVEEYTLQMVFE